jgi:hypothetical protein
MIAEPGVRFGIANALLVAALFLAGSVHLTGEETGLLALVVGGLASSGLSLRFSTGVGVVAWAMFTGFVVNRYGLLTFGHDDLLRLLAFPLATVGLATLVHTLSTRPPEVRA